MLRTLRESISHGMAGLAFVFALALGGFELAQALARVAVDAIRQNVGGVQSGYLLDFRIGDTRIEYSVVLEATLTVVLIAATLFLVWRLSRHTVRTCPECRSEIPVQASVCRYCTAELAGED